MDVFLTFHVFNTYAVSITGLLVNGFMLFIILKTRNGELKRYNNIMLQSTLSDISLGTVTFFACPVSKRECECGILIVTEIMVLTRVISDFGNC